MQAYVSSQGLPLDQNETVAEKGFAGLHLPQGGLCFNSTSSDMIRLAASALRLGAVLV
jgi:hypothetical protein